MNRNKKLVYGSLIIGIISVLVLCWIAGKKKQNPFTTENRGTNDPFENKKGNSVQKDVEFDVEVYRKWFDSETMRNPQIEWKMPIDFWGKVTDQYGNPIEGVHINCAWNDTSRKGTSEKDLLTDANGMFSLINQRGKCMFVTFNKDGYWGYVDNSPHFFEFASPYDKNFHRPDPKNPVIFRLWKPVDPQVLHGRETLLFMRSDGESIGYDLLADQYSNKGQLIISAQISTNSKTYFEYDWTLELSLSSGGFVATDSLMPYKAPEIGYTNRLIIARSKEDRPWNKVWKGNYYVYCPDDNFYGLMSFDFTACSWRWYTNSDIRITYWLNTNGSRNLEKNPASQLIKISHDRRFQ